MDFKKGFGEFFRPRNIFSRGARIGGTALGASVGQPQLGYQAGDFVADKWIDKDSAKDQGAAESFIMRGEDPTGGMIAGGVSGASSGGFSATPQRSSNVDPEMLMKMANMFQSNNAPSKKSPNVSKNAVDYEKTMMLLNMFGGKNASSY